VVSVPIPLKHIFRKNGIGYKVIIRNDRVALFALSTDKHFEVSRIYIIPANTRFGKHFPEAEAISDNDQFGIDGSRTFQNKEKALKYFNGFSCKLKAKSKNPCFTYDELTTDKLSHSDSKTYSATTEGEIVPPTQKLSATGTNIIDVVKLKEAFRKNDADYTLIQRNKYAAVYGIYFYGELCGLEVSRIHIEPEWKSPDGTYYPVREALPNNEDFGTDDSRCFFPDELERARKYFKNLTEEIISIENGSNDHFYTNN
jgi:hypothetical protein